MSDTRYIANMRGRYVWLAALSALLCAAVSAVWLRSYWRRTEICTDTYVYQIRWGGLSLGNYAQDLRWVGSGLYDRPQYDPYDESPFRHPLGMASMQPPDFESPIGGGAFAGFEYGHIRGAFGLRWYVVIPLWLPTLLLGLLTARHVREYRRGFGPGCCASCGYDLRATPEKCPECGAEPTGGKSIAMTARRK